jgi:hypothetical protein
MATARKTKKFIDHFGAITRARKRTHTYDLVRNAVSLKCRARANYPRVRALSAKLPQPPPRQLLGLRRTQRAQVEIKDINIVNHTLCVAIVIECDILRPGRKNTTDGMCSVVSAGERERERATGRGK